MSVNRSSIISFYMLQIYVFKSFVDYRVRISTITANGSRHCEVADIQHNCSIEKLNLNLALNFHRSTARAILQNRCKQFLAFIHFYLLLQILFVSSLQACVYIPNK
jgi:hypothetical protein